MSGSGSHTASFHGQTYTGGAENVDGLWSSRLDKVLTKRRQVYLVRIYLPIPTTSFGSSSIGNSQQKQCLSDTRVYLDRYRDRLSCGVLFRSYFSREAA